MKLIKTSIFKNSLLIFLLLIIGQESYSQENTSQGSLFIIGGGARPTQMVERIIEESGVVNGYGIILPFSSAAQDTAVFYAKKQFSSLGTNNIHGIIYKSGDSLKPQQLDSIRNASLIYITGGDQDRFMKIVENSGIAEAIQNNFKNGGMVAGTSAGAAVMSKKMITGTELKHPEYHSTFLHLESENLEVKEGLGLIQDVIIDQHFVRRSRYNRLLTAVIEDPTIKGIGIDEATAILVKGDEAEVVGDSQVLVFSNPDASLKSNGDKLAAEGIKIDIFLNGEKFRVR